MGMNFNFTGALMCISINIVNYGVQITDTKVLRFSNFVIAADTRYSTYVYKFTHNLCKSGDTEQW